MLRILHRVGCRHRDAPASSLLIRHRPREPQLPNAAATTSVPSGSREAHRLPAGLSEPRADPHVGRARRRIRGGFRARRTPGRSPSTRAGSELDRRWAHRTASRWLTTPEIVVPAGERRFRQRCSRRPESHDDIALSLRRRDAYRDPIVEERHAIAGAACGEPIAGACWPSFRSNAGGCVTTGGLADSSSATADLLVDGSTNAWDPRRSPCVQMTPRASTLTSEHEMTRWRDGMARHSQSGVRARCRQSRQVECRGSVRNRPLSSRRDRWLSEVDTGAVSNWRGLLSADRQRRHVSSRTLASGPRRAIAQQYRVLTCSWSRPARCPTRRSRRRLRPPTSRP